MLTPPQFVRWLEDRRAAGETNAAIGASLGVSHEAVRRWIIGDINPSETVLILAELLMRAPAGEWPLSAGSGRRG